MEDEPIINQQLFNFSVSPVAVESKPNNSYAGYIKNRMITSGVTFSELVTYTDSPYSYTFSPSTFSGSTISNNSWTGQQGFYLDFDDTISVEDVLNRFRQFDITPNFYYYTFSNSTRDIFPRFRMVMLLDEEITDYFLADNIRKNLLILFPEADKACKDAGRMYYGGRNVTTITSTPINVESIYQMIGCNTISKDTNHTRNLVKKRVFLLNVYNRDTLILTGYKKEDLPGYRERLGHLKDNKFNFNRAIETVKILRDFNEGLQLKHMELFGIATNLHWVKGGLDYMKRVMNEYNSKGITNYTPHHFSIFTYVKHYEYLPQKLSNFSPYLEDHSHTNIINATVDFQGHVEILERPELISLPEAEKLFKFKFLEALQADDNYIYIFKVFTGLGKTKALEGLEKQRIFSPTHALKEEILKRMTVKAVAVPEIPTFNSDTLRKKIKSYYDTGRNHKANKVINDLATCQPDRFNKEADIELAMNYVNQLKLSNNKDITTISTHSRGVFNTKDKSLIFDEDPYKDIFQIGIIKLSELFKINRGINSPIISKALETLCNSTPGEYYPMNFSTLDIALFDELMDDEEITTNLYRFLEASAYMVDPHEKKKDIVHYIKVNRFADHQKVIILSATPQIELYKKLYGDRVKVIDISNVEQEGQVIQYLKKSYSRANLDDYDIHLLNNYIGNIDKITFKSFKKNFMQENNIMHFGNCVGYDGLNGCDIAVVGTSHQSELVYKLIGTSLGLDVNGDDCKIEIGKKIDWKGMRFNFSTYEDEELRNIQLSMIESDQVQACGRARTLRNDCTVQLFSNLPLQITTSFETLNL